MDTVTHGLAGWLIAKAIPADRWKEGARSAKVALIVGSVLPDADSAASLLGSELYIRIHRGLSHSFPGIALTSLVVSLLIHRFGKWKDLKKLYLLTLAAQLSHVALDLLNAYGTQIFQPFSDARVAFDLLFVVDLVFTGIIVGGLVVSRGRPLRARGAFVALVAYVGVAALLHARAVDTVRTAAERGGVRVVSTSAIPALQRLPADPLRSAAASLFIPRDGFASNPGAAPREKAPGADSRSVSPEAVLPGMGGGSLPFPAGPFAWNGFVDDGKTYLRAEVDPVEETVAWKERVVRGRDVPQVRPLLRIQDVRTYLWFARYPTVSVSTVDGKTVVTFVDLRFGGISGRRPFLLKVIEAPGRLPQAQWGG